AIVVGLDDGRPRFMQADPILGAKCAGVGDPVLDLVTKLRHALQAEQRTIALERVDLPPDDDQISVNWLSQRAHERARLRVELLERLAIREQPAMDAHGFALPLLGTLPRKA